MPLKPCTGPYLDMYPASTSLLSVCLQKYSTDRTISPLFGNELEVILLRRLPDTHSNYVIEKWPNIDKCVLDDLENRNYCPTKILLKTNQTLFVNKGRLFSTKNVNAMPNQHIFSTLTWNWMFTGFTSQGINREVSNLLILNKGLNNLSKSKKCVNLSISLSLVLTSRIQVELIKNGGNNEVRSGEAYGVSIKNLVSLPVRKSCDKCLF